MRAYTARAVTLDVTVQVAALRARRHLGRGDRAPQPAVQRVRGTALSALGPAAARGELMHVLHPVQCASCGILFAVPREYFDGRVADGRAFTCPNACPVRLGLEASTDAMVRALSAELTTAHGALDALRRENCGLYGEIGLLRSAVVDTMVGAATAREGT